MRFPLTERRIHAIARLLRQRISVSSPLYAQRLSTMPASTKRKRSGAPATPPPALPNRRRSARNKDTLVEDSKEPAASGVLNGKGMGERRAKATNSHKSKQDVKRAMRNLQDMENSLQNAVKKQQLAVETSDLTVVVDEASATDPTAPNQPTQPPRSRKKQIINEYNGEHPDSVEQAPLDNYEAELADGDLPTEPRDDGIERGARRPPPVNSDQLPLPWTGRLGYVRPDNPRWSHGHVAGLVQTMGTEVLTDHCDLGVPKHLFESFEPSGLLLQDLSHGLHR